MKNTILILISLLVFTGCELMQTRATTQYNAIEAAVQVADKEWKACPVDKEAKRYVRENIEFHPDDTENKYRLLQSKRLFAYADKEPFMTYLKDTSVCDYAFLNKMDSIKPRVAANMRVFRGDKDREYIRFIQGEINVGQLNSNIGKLRDGGMAKEKDIEDERYQKYTTTHNREAEAIAKAFQKIDSDMKESQRNNRTTTTNCQVLGNTARCTSN